MGLRSYFMRAFRLAGVAAAMAVGMAAGCNDLGVGKRCLSPTDAGISGTQISSPSLECMSRLCLLQGKDPTGHGPDPPRTTCTAKCTTDDDCAGAVIGNPNSPNAAQSGQCFSKFVCAVATTV